MQNKDPQSLRLGFIICRIGSCACALGGLIFLFRNLPLGLLFVCLGLFGTIFSQNLKKKYEEACGKDDP